DLATAVAALAPDGLALCIEQHREAGASGQVQRVHVQGDLDAVGMVAAVGVGQHVAAGDQVKVQAALEEKPARVAQRTFVVERGHRWRGQEQRVDLG
ncbi:hypothetical protein RZS08_10715, partial [Arthrospira platensis SPKY1]|nr:hypothetical protein [Arthrospira platensis SPKY1]